MFLENPLSTYWKTVEYYRGKSVFYLYSNVRQNIPPVTWEVTENESRCQGKHEFYYYQEQYGEAIIVFILCTVCGTGIVECNPPLRVKKVQN